MLKTKFTSTCTMLGVHSLCDCLVIQFGLEHHGHIGRVCTCGVCVCVRACVRACACVLLLYEHCVHVVS